MNEATVIKAVTRNKIGKNASYRLRQKGSIPAVLYGHNFPPVTLSVSTAELNAILKPGGHGAGEHVLHKLTVLDRDDLSDKTIIIKEIQRDPISQKIIHIDLLAVKMDEKIIVPVRINIIGKAQGVQMGGILQQILREVEIKCFPAEIPQHFDLDVSNLAIGQSLHVRDIPIPEHFEIHADPNAAVLSVVAPVVTKEAEPTMEEGVAPKVAEEEKKPQEKDKTV